MSNSHQFGAGGSGSGVWNRRPRSELRFFADLEEQNNRNDYSFQRRVKHFKPYERSDRFSYSKHQRDYGSRDRFSSGSHKYNTTTSSNRNEHMIHPMRRCESDEPFPPRSAASALRIMSRAGRSQEAQKRGCSPCRGGDDENADRESYQQSAVSDDSDSGHVRRLKDNKYAPASRVTAEELYSNCRSRRESGETSGSSHRLGSESSASGSTLCQNRTHIIDLVHMTEEEDEAAAAAAAPHAAKCSTSDTPVNRYDAASISTITSAELSHREDTDMSISENEGNDSSCSGDGDDDDSRGDGSHTGSRDTKWCSDWDSRSLNQRPSESNSDAVFPDPDSPQRKFTSRGYQAFCDRRNGYWDSRRSFSRSSPISFQHKNTHFSTRLYDFDDYYSPDRDERINRTLYLGSLDPKMTEQQIRQLFEPFGEIKSVFVKKVDRSRNTTYGFVKMGNLLQAVRARSALNGHRLGFLKLVIRYGKTYPTRRVWLGNLSPEIDSHMLYRELDRFGAVVKMIHFRASGEALVEFESVPGAVEAKNEMRGVILDAKGSITRCSSSSSSSSSRPASTATSTPSPPPPHPAHPSPAHPLLSQASDPVPTPATTPAAAVPAVISRCRGIITDFEDMEEHVLLDSGSSIHNRVQSASSDNPAPPDSSFQYSSTMSSSRMFFALFSYDRSHVYGYRCHLISPLFFLPDDVSAGVPPEAADSRSLTSDSEEDEVHLHESSIKSPDDQNGAHSEQPYGCPIVCAEQWKLPSNKLWADGGSAAGAAGDTSLSPAVLRPNPATAMSLKGPPAGGRPPAVFSFEPEDLMNKSLTRLDPRLMCRSGVYREKSVFDTD